MYNPDIHKRRSIRLKGYDYSQAGAYFVTICTKDRECLFGDITNGEMQLNIMGTVVQQYWNKIPRHFPNTAIDEFIVMPNHVHGIICIETNFVGAIHELPLHEYKRQRRKMLLPKIIGWFKMQSAKQINQIRNTRSNPVWQRNYYEHIIRNEQELNTIRKYILTNPLKWELDEYYGLHKS